MNRSTLNFKKCRVKPQDLLALRETVCKYKKKSPLIIIEPLPLDAVQQTVHFIIHCGPMSGRTNRQQHLPTARCFDT